MTLRLPSISLLIENLGCTEYIISLPFNPEDLDTLVVNATNVIECLEVGNDKVHDMRRCMVNDETQLCRSGTYSGASYICPWTQ